MTLKLLPEDDSSDYINASFVGVSVQIVITQFLVLMLACSHCLRIIVKIVHTLLLKVCLYLLHHYQLPSGVCLLTSGPLPHTVDDFWRMVWEHDLPTIVMLTQLEESGKVIF